MRQENRQVGLWVMSVLLGLGMTSSMSAAGASDEDALGADIEERLPVDAAVDASVNSVVADPRLAFDEMSTVSQAEREVSTPEEGHGGRDASVNFQGFEPLRPRTTSVPGEEKIEVDLFVSDAMKSDTVNLATPLRVVPDERITVQLDKAGLEETINLFSRLSGVNIIIPQLDKEGTVTVNLVEVDWKPALQSVLESYDLELYQKVPSVEIYTIRAKSPDAPEPMELKTFKLNYATVDEVETLVKSMMGGGSTVAKFPSRNMITVRSSAAVLEELDVLITSVDIPRQQVFIEAKFLELSDSASESIGLDWQVLDSYGVGASTLSSSYNGTKTKAVGTIGTNSLATSTDNYDTSDGSTALWLPDAVNQTAISKVATSVLAADDFRLVLSALKELNGTKVVSNPKIIVANEEMATIQIGDKIPNIKGTTTTSGDSQTITTYELDDTEPYFTDGILVSVTPTVNTENNISVKIEPTLDRLNSTPTTAGDGTEFYGKTTKTINTVFSLQSGQTAAIGGLTEVSDTSVDRKIPVLGSIPLLGRLFSYSSKSKEQVETIIFVTVGLANPDTMDFDTGLPEDADLVRRYRLMNATDRAVVREELRLLEVQEAERAESRLRALRESEKKRIDRLNKSNKVKPAPIAELEVQVDEAMVESWSEVSVSD